VKNGSSHLSHFLLSFSFRRQKLDGSDVDGMAMMTDGQNNKIFWKVSFFLSLSLIYDEAPTLASFSKMMMRCTLASFLCIGSLFLTSDAFVTKRTTFRWQHSVDSPRSSPSLPPSDSPLNVPSSRLYATAQEPTAARRTVLLGRNGPHFLVERMKGTIEFGATANLVTQLDNKASAKDDIMVWLQDERGLALSIWDKKLMKEMGDSVYRLQVMPLRFVTLVMSPWVDVRMKTAVDPATQQPVFTVQSINFDPNIEIMPGMRISAQSLGVVIEVAGELRPSADGKGVTGCIAFQTKGKLPPPMRLLPEPALKAASDTINQTIVNFAVKNFQQGAGEMYRDFQSKKQ
jgi:hypothetical protein